MQLVKKYSHAYVRKSEPRDPDRKSSSYLKYLLTLHLGSTCVGEITSHKMFTKQRQVGGALSVSSR